MSACVAAAQSTLLAAAQCQQATQQRNVRATASVGAAKRMLLPKHRHNIGMSRSSSRSLVVAAAAQAEVSRAASRLRWQCKAATAVPPGPPSRPEPQSALRRAATAVASLRWFAN